MFKLYNGNCADIMCDLPEKSIDLTVTSPPYDKLRDYNGYNFDCRHVINQLHYVMKPGGVVVWIVNDQMINNSESGSCFKQALYFMENGFLLHDTMIWQKPNFSVPSTTRYHQTFEYMFVFSRGQKPKTFNPICDREVVNGTCFGKNTKRQVDGTMKEMPKKVTSVGMRHNVWIQNTAGQENPGKSLPHPAMFPLQLAKDHILSWSNEGDTVLDPMMGSGTTGIACKKLNRDFIGIEISTEYYEIAKKRIDG